MFPVSRLRRIWSRGAIEIALIVAPAIAWLGRRFNADLWTDEITTLLFYCDGSLWHTVTDYSNTNNHILFSVVATLFLAPLRLIGLDDPALFRHPWIPRILTLACAAVTVALVARVVRRHIDKDLAPLAAVVLVTAIPFYNFSLQLRGYALSMPLLAYLIDRVWTHGVDAEVDAESRGFFGRFPRWPIAATAAALIYTLPTNAMFVAGVGVAELASLLHDRRRVRPVAKNIAALAVGSMIGAMLYLPTLPSVLNSTGNALAGQFRESHGWPIETITVMAPEVARSFLSWQWLPAVMIAVALAVGACAFLLKPLWRTRRAAERLLYAAAIAATSFGVCYIAGIADSFSGRLLSAAAPVYALAVCAAVAVVYRLAPAFERFRIAILAVYALYAYVIFAAAQPLLDRRALLDVLESGRSQDLTHNFYLERYRYQPLIERMERIARENDAPILLYRHVGTGSDEPLAMLGIPIQGRQDWMHPEFGVLAAQLAPLDRAYVLTIQPVLFVEEMLRAMPDRRLTRINRDWDFHNLYLVERKTEDP